MSDLFSETQRPKNTNPIDGIFEGMLSFGTMIQRGISWKWGNGTAGVKPLDFGLTGIQFNYKWNKDQPTDPTVRFFLNFKW